MPNIPLLSKVCSSYCWYLVHWYCQVTLFQTAITDPEDPSRTRRRKADATHAGAMRPPTCCKVLDKTQLPVWVVQSRKNPVSASAMLTGKCLQIRKFLRQVHYWLKNFRILCNTKYPDNMESVRMNWKVSGQSKKCLDNLENVSG